MSKRRWNRRIVDILRELGVPLDAHAEETIAHEREVDTSATTEDIVLRLALAPQETVTRALEIAKSEGSTEVLSDGFTRARVSMQEARDASVALADVASEIARRTP